MRGIRIAIGTLATTALLGAPAGAGAAPSVTGEFALPAGTDVGSNNEITQGPDGNMWITVQGENAIVKVTPDGAATKFTPPGMAAPASGIVSGPDGNLWAAHSGGVIRIPPANPNAADQFSYGVAGGQGITVGPDGNIWFAATGKLIQIPPATPNAPTQHNVAAIVAPKGMTTGSDGLLWIADQGGGGNVISATATNPPVTTSYLTGGGPQDVAAGLNAQVAYPNPTTSPMTVGRITPGGTPLTTPLENTDPFGVAFGQDGAYWIARTSGNDLLRLTPDGNVTTLGGFAAHVLGPRKIATGPGNTLWVTIDMPDMVARVSGVEPPPAPDPDPEPEPEPDPGPGPGPDPTPTAPETTLGKVPKKKVKTAKPKVKVAFEFSSPTPGATFECALTKKGKEPSPKPCTSPATYKVKPGRYTFEVSASAGGL